ncbi:MAG: VWA domain-containing protein [Acidimicrobiia bacterium]|nr:VWA domain-containing protein [Acidimicrobiia bacterium]
MTRISFILTTSLMIATIADEALRGQSQTGRARQDIPVQDGPSVATFKSGVDLVRVSAVVRDRKGRFVRHLTASDFSVLDEGRIRPISDFRHDLSGVSIAVLFDVSGSMEARLKFAREAASHLFGWLDPTRDEAAVFAFDTRLTQLTPFTMGLRVLPEELDLLTPFGATGLHDAIAQTARRLEGREGRRRAVVVLTDGVDNASRLSPSEVSGIASAIDVPVYVVGIVPSIDNPSAESAVPSAARSALTGSLANLAEWTGGYSFVASTPGERSAASRQIVEELRHRYLLAFESSTRPGWHPLIVRARDKDLTVRARSGYFAGQSRPHSQ